MRYDAVRFNRFLARHQMTRAHVVLCVLFGMGHPQRTLVSLLLDFARGIGPAAIAAGRVTRS